MRKWFSMVVVLSMVFVLVLSGCSNASNHSGVTNQSEGESARDLNTTQNESSPSETVNLQFSIWGNEAHKAMYEELLIQFNEIHPHIQVEIITIPFPDYLQKLSIMSASKTAPDVGWLAERMIPQFLNSELLTDISLALKEDEDYQFDDIFPSTLALFEKDDQLFGVPFSTPPSTLFFNKTLFEQNGLKTPLEYYEEGSWDYDTFLNAAKAITDREAGVYGVKLVREWKNWSGTLDTVIRSQGAELFNEDGTQFVFHSAEGQKALEIYQDMIFVDEVHPKPGDEVTFETGKLGMFKDRYSYVSNARAIEDFEWDIAPMPEGPNGRGTTLGYAGYSVFESDHPEEAIELLKFFTNQASMAVTSQYFVPSRKSILESDVFLNAAPHPSPESIKLALIDQMADAKVTFSHANWQKIDVQMQILLDFLYTQDSTVEEILKTMHEQVTPLLTE